MYSVNAFCAEEEYDASRLHCGLSEAHNILRAIASGLKIKVKFKDILCRRQIEDSKINIYQQKYQKYCN